MHNQFLFQNKPFLLAVNVYAWYTARWLTTNTREGLENTNRMTHIYFNIATYNDYVWTHETGVQSVLSFILTVDSVSSITSYTVLAKAYIYTKVLCYIHCIGCLMHWPISELLNMHNLPRQIHVHVTVYNTFVYMHTMEPLLKDTPDTWLIRGLDQVPTL